MQVTFELVEKAEAAGVPVGAVYTYGDADYMDITINPVDEADSPRLAEALGLTLNSRRPGDEHEGWQARFGPAYVHTSRRIPAEVAP
jgi:hypothetical protein